MNRDPAHVQHFFLAQYEDEVEDEYEFEVFLSPFKFGLPGYSGPRAIH